MNVSTKCFSSPKQSITILSSSQNIIWFDFWHYIVFENKENQRRR
jgi:hypothetical protein